METNPNTLYQHESPFNKLYLIGYRTNSCSGYCSNPDCLSTHADQQSRRLPLPENNKIGWNYSPTMCKSTSSCKFGRKCLYSHNNEERDFHPLKFRVRMCKYAGNSVKKCSSKGLHCAFAHSEEELREPGIKQKKQDEFNLEKYRTVECGCNENGCGGYHSKEERRRDLSEFKYSPVPCAAVYNGSTFLLSGNCKKLDQCEYAHNWNEVHYHPEIHKTKKCKKNRKCRTLHCPFVHFNEKIEQEEENEEEKKGENERNNEAAPQCSACQVGTAEWGYTCGTQVCESCLGAKCSKCGYRHITKICWCYRSIP